jgi:hypothetical protein
MDKTIKLWDLAKGKELATLSSNSGGVIDVAFSPDGTRVAGMCDDDGKVKLWDVASRKEISGKPDFPMDFRVAEIDSKNRRKAEMDGLHAIRIVPLDSGLDLLAAERAGYLRLESGKIVWTSGGAANATRGMRPIHYRNDLYAQLAAPDVSPAKRIILQVQLCAKGGAWRPLPVLWREVRAAGLEQDAEVRRVFLRHYAIAVRALAVQRKPAFPADLSQMLAEQLKSGDFSDLSLASPLAQAWPVLAKSADPQVIALRESLAAALHRAAPQDWIKAVMESDR